MHEEAVAAAKKAGARISVDLNFRKKLWTEAAAQQVMRPLMKSVDVVIANEEDIQSVLGLTVANTDVVGGHLDVGAYRTVAEQITRELGPSMVAITLAREHLGERQRLERGAVGRQGEPVSPQPAL